MTTEDRIESLRQRHAELEKSIEEENLRPHPDDVKLHELKREKLRIKDEIYALSEGVS